MVKIQLAHPEFLPSALETLKRIVDLQLKGMVPQSISAWMILVPILRVLRAVFGGNNHLAVARLAEHLKQKEKDDEEWYKSPEGQKMVADIEQEMREMDEKENA